VLVAAARNGIVRVSGLPALPVTTLVLAGVDVRCLAVDPSDRSRIYAGTQSDGVLGSQDGGLTWRPAGLEGLSVKALATSLAAPGTIWAGTKPPRVFRSGDNGETWEELPAFARMRRWWWLQPAERPHTAYVSTLAVSPGDPDVIVAGIEAFKLLRSADGGRTWQRVGRGVALDAHELAFHPGDPERVFLAAGLGASVSLDSGATWTKMNAGLDRRYGFCVAPDPRDPESAFLGAAPLRTAHTANARACLFKLVHGRWEKVGHGLPEQFDRLPTTIATSPLEPESVYVGLSDGTIWHSSEGGGTWNVLAVRLPGLRRLVLIS